MSDNVKAGQEQESTNHGRAWAESVREKSLSAAREVLLDACQELFEANPDLRSFGWSQETNETPLHRAEPRVFAYTSHPDINGIDGLTLDKLSLPDVKLQHRVATLLTEFDDDLMRMVFGIDVHITIHRDGTVQIRACYDDDDDFCCCDHCCCHDDDRDDDDCDDYTSRG